VEFYLLNTLSQSLDPLSDRTQRMVGLCDLELQLNLQVLSLVGYREFEHIVMLVIRLNINLLELNLLAEAACSESSKPIEMKSFQVMETFR
jgi:hypothetical protein